MKVKWVWTIPNMLSLLRLALIPAFAVLYLMSARHPALLAWAIVALVLSGVTDLFDGMLARKLNQVTDIGKLLDPAADKLTQVTVVLCLAIRMPRLWPLLILCFLKELLQAVGAALLLFRKKAPVQSAHWYGKVSTVVFYAAMAMFVVFPPEPETALLFGWHMPGWVFVALVCLVSLCMLFAFIQYARLFVKVSREIEQGTDE